MTRSVLLALALVVALLACSTPKPCDGPQLEVELAFFAPDQVQSLLVSYGGDRREIIDVDGAPSIEVELRAAPYGSNVTIEVRAYDGDDIRGRLLGVGSVGPLRLDACADLQVELTDRFVLEDAGVPDAATKDDAGPIDGDAGGDAGVIGEDAGADAGEDAGAPACAIAPDNATLALFPFDDGEAASGAVVDAIGGVTGYARPDSVAVGSTEGAAGCGTAALFSGDGYLEIPDEGLAPSSGSVDFYVRFDGPGPTVRQGIVSRDADGQMAAGHLTLFRSCDDHLIARLQDTVQTAYRCSDRPLPAGTWTHVSLAFGAPSTLLSIDGAVQTSSGTRFANSDCTFDIPCDDPGVFDPSANRNPWVLGADCSLCFEGSTDPVRALFDGAVDQFRVSTARRTP